MVDHPRVRFFLRRSLGENEDPLAGKLGKVANDLDTETAFAGDQLKQLDEVVERNVERVCD